VSPTTLLAAKCSGNGPQAAEGVFDEEFLGLLERHHGVLERVNDARFDAREGDAVLGDLASRLESRLTELQPPGDSLRRGVRPLTLLAMLIGLPLAAWLAWSIFVDYRIRHVESVARSVVDANAQMRGYPLDVKAIDQGRSLTISGLAPAPSVKSELIAQIGAALPDVAIRDSLSAVAASGPDVAPLIAAMAREQAILKEQLQEKLLRQSTDRARRYLAETARLMGAFLPNADAGASSSLKTLSADVAALEQSLPVLTAARRLETWTRLVTLTERLNGLAAAGTAGRPKEPDQSALDDGSGLADQAEQVLAATRAYIASQEQAARLLIERAGFARETKQLSDEAVRLKAEIAALAARPVPTIPQPTAREQLQRYVREHAIFFSEATAYRDPAAANRILDDLAALVSGQAALVRIVGYTDDVGSPAKNAALSKSRAEAVAAALVSRGVAPSKLVTLGRASPETNVSPVLGPGSSNRRVEFELGFEDEGAP
jgi:outer membrane protein OmpA-like peptidoglycan-associated protein